MDIIPLSLSDAARLVGANLVAHPDKPLDTSLTGINTIEAAGPMDLTFLSNPKYAQFLSQTRAGAVLLTDEVASSCPTHALVLDNPYVGFAKLAAYFDREPPPPAGIDPTAQVDETATIDPSAHIGPHVTIAAGVRIGAGVQVQAGCRIARGVMLGDSTILKPNVTVYKQVVLGQRCLVHSGAIIGCDGFGIANDRGRWIKIPQTGSVSIGDDVEIGANTTIDRGALGDTRIADGVKIDNQVQIAHNVEIGAHTAIAAQVGIAGSTKVGAHCMIGGGSGINGHIEITDQVTIAGMSMVTRSIKQSGVYASGIPARDHKQWQRNVGRFQRLDSMADRLKRLEQQMASSE